MPFLHVNGTSLYYEMHGSGTPLVFVHSHGFSHEMFFPQVHYFCKQGYQVILVDLRGNGQSGKLGTAVDDIVKQQCEDLKMMLEQWGISSAVFVGAADGGVLVQQFAMAYPERVSAIVLVDTHSKPAVAGLWGKLLTAMRAATWLTYYLPGESFVRGLKATYARWDVAYSFLRAGMLRKRPTEWIKQRLALGRVSGYSGLSRMSVPALCIVGDYSPEGMKQMQRTAEMIPDAEFAVLEDAFVPSHLCQPRPFNDEVMRFLEKHRHRIDPAKSAPNPNVAIDF